MIRDAAAPDAGIWESVDVPRLIEKVYLAPWSAPEFQDAVATAVQRAGFEIEVVRSAMAADPEF